MSNLGICQPGPVAYEQAAQRARDAGDLSAASRLELSGSGACIGHHRAERHEQRAWRDDPHNSSYATAEDLAKYMHS